MSKNKIYEMLMDRWADAGPSLGGWGINGAYFKKNGLSTSDDTASSSMALNLNTGKQTELKKGGKVKCMSKGGSTASKRADGCATKGKTKGRMI